MSQAIDDLRHDHDAILFALKILGRMEVLVRKGEVAASDISEFMGFLKEFVDKCHHGKEEGMLFPAVTKAAMPESGDQVAVLLSEHAQGRVFVKAMEDASAPVIKATEFAAAAKSYSDLLKAHIEKENTVLFPLAEHILSTAELNALYRAFEEHEAKVIGQGRHEELHRMLDELKVKYLG